MQKDYRVMFVSPGAAELVEAEFHDIPAEGEVIGRNLMSLISTGSERGGFSQEYEAEAYPIATGYASIAQVLSVGEHVDSLKTGDLFFHHGNHTLFTKVKADKTVAVPIGLAPEKALYGRFAAVSMTSIYHSKIKPVDHVIVTGLGMVGLMCAQILKCYGYLVYGIDPSPERLEIAKKTGLINVGSSLEEWEGLKYQCGALFECSGNEHAIRTAIPYLRKGGEIFQIGVPWQKNADFDVHTLLRDLFYGYLSLHGGWEWSLPEKEDDFHIHTSSAHIRSAMELIADGRMQVVDAMYELRDPRDCGKIYREIMIPRMKPTSIILDWRNFI